MPILAPHIAIAHFEGRAVLLDIRAGRYSLVGPRAARILTMLEAGGDDDGSPTARALRQAGILTDGPAGSVARIVPPPPLASARETAPSPGPELPMRQVLSTTLNATLRLRFTRFQSVMRWAAARASPRVDGADAASLLSLAQSFDRLRAYVPIPRVCLRDALALHHILQARGMGCHLVFGVRLDPFGAHCWVQHEQMILTDTMGAVREMRPILLL